MSSPIAAARTALLALAALGLAGVLIAPSTSAAPAARTRGTTTVAARNGMHIGDNPVLRPSQRIALAVPGFAGGAEVTVQIACHAALHPNPRAGADGVLHVMFPVPADLGSGPHLLTFSGAGPTTSSAAPAGSVVVRVPQLWFFDFRTATGVPAKPCE
jgi:hypothetical protein